MAKHSKYKSKKTAIRDVDGEPIEITMGDVDVEDETFTKNKHSSKWLSILLSVLTTLIIQAIFAKLGL